MGGGAQQQAPARAQHAAHLREPARRCRRRARSPRPPRPTSKLASASSHGAFAGDQPQRRARGGPRARGAAAPRRRRPPATSAPARGERAPRTRPSPQPTSSTRSPGAHAVEQEARAQLRSRSARGPRAAPPRALRGRRASGIADQASRRGRRACRDGAADGAKPLSACSEALSSTQRCAKRLCSRCELGRVRMRGARAGMRVAFDSRPVADPHGVGRYSRCLLERAARDRRGGR